MSRRERLSTSARVAWTVTGVLVAGVAALSGISYTGLVRQMSAENDRALLREAESFSSSVGRRAGSDQAADLRELVRSYLEIRSVTNSPSHPILLVRLANGKILSNTDVRLDRARENAGVLRPATADRRFLDVTYAGERYRVATVPIRDASSKVAAVFEAALPLDPTDAIAQRLLLTLAAASGLVVFLGTLLSLLAARASLRPLRQAAITTERVTHAHLAERIGYDGPDDEVGRLVGGVNGMLDRLESAFREQRRFLADASHELRTPLAIVGGHLEVLRNDGLSPGEREDELALLADETARMSRLVEDMLGLARLEAGPPRPFQPLDVRVLLLEAAGRGTAPGDPRRFSIEAPEGLWTFGEPDQLLEALLNLVSNAVTHTSLDGRIWLKAGSDGDDIVIRVEDDGDGIPEEDIPRLFDRFFRSRGPRGAGGGSGLGLAIVRRLVELHDGTITAANREGGGASFTIHLPRSRVLA